jgi:hypothetical protein
MAEWTKNKKPVYCPWVRITEDKYDFDITKADQIFDMLLAAKRLQLSANHTIPSAEELRTRGTANFIILYLTIPMIAKSSVSIFNWLLHKEGSSLKQLRRR